MGRRAPSTGADTLSDIDITTELGAIRSSLLDWPEATITGGKLNGLIREAAPGLDMRAAVGMPKGPGALSAFVLGHLSEDLDKVSYSGMDVVYRIKGRTVTDIPDNISAQVWRTFVSPSSSKRLVLERSAPLLVARDAPPSPDDAEIEIAKVRSDEHDSIRRAFSEALDPPAADALKRGAGNTDADFDTWIAALRRVLPGSVRAWGQFRRRKLAELFQSRIDGLGLEPTSRSSVLEQVAAAEHAYYVKDTSKADAGESPPSHVRTAPTTNDALGRARQLAHAAIDQMTLEELRATRLPLGVVLDAERT